MADDYFEYRIAGSEWRRITKAAEDDDSAIFLMNNEGSDSLTYDTNSGMVEYRRRVVQ